MSRIWDLIVNIYNKCASKKVLKVSLNDLVYRTCNLIKKYTSI